MMESHGGFPHLEAAEDLLNMNEDLLQAVLENLQIGRLQDSFSHLSVLQHNLSNMAIELDTFHATDDAYENMDRWDDELIRVNPLDQLKSAAELPAKDKNGSLLPCDVCSREQKDVEYCRVLQGHIVPVGGSAQTMTVKERQEFLYAAQVIQRNHEALVTAEAASRSSSSKDRRRKSSTEKSESEPEIHPQLLRARPKKKSLFPTLDSHLLTNAVTSTSAASLDDTAEVENQEPVEVTMNEAGRNVSHKLWSSHERFATLVAYGLHGHGKWGPISGMVGSRSKEQIRTAVSKGRIGDKVALENALSLVFPPIPDGFRFTLFQRQALVGRGARFGENFYDNMNSSDEAASETGSRLTLEDSEEDEDIKRLQKLKTEYDGNNPWAVLVSGKSKINPPSPKRLNPVVVRPSTRNLADLREFGKPPSMGGQMKLRIKGSERTPVLTVFNTYFGYGLTPLLITGDKPKNPHVVAISDSCDFRRLPSVLPLHEKVQQPYIPAWEPALATLDPLTALTETHLSQKRRIQASGLNKKAGKARNAAAATQAYQEWLKARRQRIKSDFSDRCNEDDGKPFKLALKSTMKKRGTGKLAIRNRQMNEWVVLKAAGLDPPPLKRIKKTTQDKLEARAATMATEPSVKEMAVNIQALRAAAEAAMKERASQVENPMEMLSDDSLYEPETSDGEFSSGSYASYETEDEDEDDDEDDGDGDGDDGDDDDDDDDEDDEDDQSSSAGEAEEPLAALTAAEDSILSRHSASSWDSEQSNVPAGLRPVETSLLASVIAGSYKNPYRSPPRNLPPPASTADTVTSPMPKSLGLAALLNEDSNASMSTSMWNASLSVPSPKKAPSPAPAPAPAAPSSKRNVASGRQGQEVSVKSSLGAEVDMPKKDTNEIGDTKTLAGNKRKGSPMPTNSLKKRAETGADRKSNASEKSGESSSSNVKEKRYKNQMIRNRKVAGETALDRNVRMAQQNLEVAVKEVLAASAKKKKKPYEYKPKPKLRANKSMKLSEPPTTQQQLRNMGLLAEASPQRITRSSSRSSPISSSTKGSERSASAEIPVIRSKKGPSSGLLNTKGRADLFNDGSHQIRVSDSLSDVGDIINNDGMTSFSNMPVGEVNAEWTHHDDIYSTSSNAGFSNFPASSLAAFPHAGGGYMHSPGRSYQQGGVTSPGGHDMLLDATAAAVSDGLLISNINDELSFLEAPSAGAMAQGQQNAARSSSSSVGNQAFAQADLFAQLVNGTPGSPNRRSSRIATNTTSAPHGVASKGFKGKGKVAGKGTRDSDRL